MNFLDGSLFPENQQKLVITCAPYGPEWEPSDFPEDIPVTMEAQIQKAVDCYNAGATVLHVHVREPDGKGSKNLDMFNEMLAGLESDYPGRFHHVDLRGEVRDADWVNELHVNDKCYRRIARRFEEAIQGAIN